MLKKNEVFEVEIIDNGFKGEGIAKIDGFTVFVPGAIKGEKIKMKIVKVNSSHAFGIIEELIEKSPDRVEPDCPTYRRCGGCSLRHMNYDATIALKEQAVKSTLKKALGREIELDEIIKMDEPFYYRNKLQYPVGKKNGKAVLGVYAERTHEIIETNSCMIQNKLSQEIANDIVKFANENGIEAYDEENLTGTIRHIVIRYGKKTKEVMVTLITNREKIEKEKELIDFLTSKYKEIKTIVKNINSKNTNVILGDHEEVLFGDGYIYDYIKDCKFKISSKSFYQVNPVQTEKLYQKAVDYAALSGEETIFDLYCGIGTIGIFASKNVKKIIGIETIKEAIDDAKLNAEINNIENAEFFVGDVEKVLPELLEKRKVSADVIFVDPPRKGCDDIAIETILKIEPKKIVYVSCNPATLGRDLKKLEEKYNIEKISICDMFPYTSHCESIAALKRK